MNIIIYLENENYCLENEYYCLENEYYYILKKLILLST